MKCIRRFSRAAHAWMRSGDISFRVCVALRLLWMPRATPTSVGQPYVGNQSPHVGIFTTRRINLYLHAWKAGFAGRAWDHGRGSRIDASHGHLHFVEDPGKRRALLPTPGRKPHKERAGGPAVIAHDQHPSRKTAFPASHAGTRVSSQRNSFRRCMGAPEIPRNDVMF